MNVKWQRLKQTNLNLALIFILLLVCQVGFIWRNNTLRSFYAAARPLDGRVWGYTPADVNSLFNGLDVEGRLFYAESEMSLDLVFPLLYALFLAGLIKGLWHPSRLWWVPWMAASADLLENLLIAYLAWAHSPSVTPPTLGWLALGFSSLKWLLVSLSITLVVAGIVTKWGKKYVEIPGGSDLRSLSGAEAGLVRHGSPGGVRGDRREVEAARLLFRASEYRHCLIRRSPC